MKFKTCDLSKELLAAIKPARAFVFALKNADEQLLRYKRKPSEWNILECIEHLNICCGHYLPEIEQKIIDALPSENTFFQSSTMGNHFVKIVRADKHLFVPAKAPKDKDPLDKAINRSAIGRLIENLEKLELLLRLSKRVSWTLTTVKIGPKSNFTLRLGDTFRFIVYHVQRHVIQMEKLKDDYTLFASGTLAKTL